MSSSARRALATLAALAAASVLHAQPSGVYFTSPMTVGVTRESNFIVDGVALEDNVLIVQPPTFSLVKMSARGELALSYQPEIEAFATYHELSSLNHAVDFVLSHALDPRLTFTLADDFVATSDPSRRVVESILLLPRNRLTENTAYVELSRKFGAATTFTVRGDNTITTLAVSPDSPLLLNDHMATSGSVSLSHLFARRHLVTLTYSAIDSRPFHQTPPLVQPSGLLIVTAAVDRAQSGGLSYVYEGDDFSIRTAGGVVSARDITYTGFAEIEKSLGRDASFSVSAQRNLSHFGSVTTVAAPETVYHLDNGLLPMGLFEAVTVRLRGDLSRAVSVGADASTQHAFSDLSQFDVRSQYARLRVDYHVSRTLALFGTVELYRQSFNEFVGTELDWKRVGLGFTVAVSRKPNPLEQRRKDRAARERRARRGEAAEDDPGAPAAPINENEGDADADNGTRH
jgi:hypothetical protein